MNPPPPTSSTGIYTLSWSTCTGATSYTLQRDTDPGFGSPTPLVDANVTSYTENVGNGTHYYRVRASNSAGSSNWTHGGPTTVSTTPRP